MFNRDDIVNTFARNVVQSNAKKDVFLTAVEKVNRTEDIDSIFNQTIRDYYSKLTGKVTKLDSMIDTVLSKHEKEFMAAFKVHMH